MAPFYCTIIINIVYIQFLLQTKSQFTQIWYDDMETDNGLWTASGEVNFAYASSGCFNSLCTKTFTSAYVLRSTNISGYSSLQLKYDVSCDELEAGESCNVHYSYDSMIAKTLLATFDPPDDENRHYWPDQIHTLPSSASKSIVYIWFETQSVSGVDACYWDNVYLMGIIHTEAPTPQPNHPSDTEETVIDEEQEEPAVIVTKDTNLVITILLFNGIICFLGALLIFIIHKIIEKKKRIRKTMHIVEENVDNDENPSGPGYKENANLSDIKSVAMSGTVAIRSHDIVQHIECEGEEQEDDIEDMYNNSLNRPKTVESMGENVNAKGNENDVGTNDIENTMCNEVLPTDIGVNIGKCRDCGEFKKGRVDGDRSRQFYCDRCWSNYVEEEAMGTAGTTTGDTVGNDTEYSSSCGV